MMLSQNTKELVNINNLDFGEGGISENIIMVVLGYDVFCIGFESTIYKLVIIRICSNKMKMVIDLHHLSIGQVEQGLDNVGCDAKETSADSWCRGRCSSLLVWCAHMLVFPFIDDVIVDFALIPKAIDGIFCLIGEILAKQTTNVFGCKDTIYCGNKQVKIGKSYFFLCKDI